MLYLSLAIMPAVLILCFSTGALSQKSEHYNSPLYAPKTYDPSQSVTTGLPDALKKIGIEQKLGSQLPLDAEFKDENGRTVKLGDYFNNGRPVIVAFVYYECPMLCNEVLNGLPGPLKYLFRRGKGVRRRSLSFDARENEKPDLPAIIKKLHEPVRTARFEKGWHFLTGTQASIEAATEAAGFGFSGMRRAINSLMQAVSL